MENLGPGTIAVIAGVGLLVLMFSRTARIVALVAALIFIVLAAGPAVLRSKSCSGSGLCLLQPTYAGPCFPQNGTAVLRTNGNCFIALDVSTATRATCVDWRDWT